MLVLQLHSFSLLVLLILKWKACYPYNYFFYSLEFFTSALVDGFSMESKWQQVSSSLQDSSQDSGRSQQYCRLDSLYPSANFQVLQAFQ